MYHIAICDDEKKFTLDLQGLLARYSAETGQVIKVSSFMDGAELIEEYPLDADLIFLDIRMEKMSGLQAAEKIREKDANVSIVFLTSLAQYALEGYKYSAASYIIKPIHYSRLKSELDKLLVQNTHKGATYIIAENDAGRYKISLSSLSHIETFNRNLMLHTDKENIISYRTMRDVERELESHSFVRCHAGYLVNLFYVKQIEKLEIELINGDIIPISQMKRKLVLEKLSEYWGGKL
jgi:DNA-binding LytR/AlgR family response regulator